MLTGAVPVQASSGRVVRHRLNRSGDRQLNLALHTMVIIRERYHQPTKRYVARRTAEGKSQREIRRCLKHTVVLQLYRQLEREATPSKDRVGESRRVATPRRGVLTTFPASTGP
jgi:transposase